MTLAAMERFVKEIKKALGRYPVIYGGSLLRQVTENIGGTILSECPLWFARYNNQPLWNSRPLADLDLVAIYRRQRRARPTYGSRHRAL
jgi:GH25 family lysozyme M1 (1,4-beta-N-acetylmuramidase)